MITSSSTTFGSGTAHPDTDPADPLALAEEWLPEHEDGLRPLMALSTTDLDGYPDVRHVLLSAFDGAAFYFNTDVRSRKTAQLESDSRAALALVWPDIGRQLVVQGDVQRVSDEEAASVFQQRSRYLQVLAWVNDDQTARMPLAERRDAWERFAEAHPPGSLLAPPSWYGYKIAPRRMTFWRGDSDGPSNRLEYRYIANAWTLDRLAG